MTSLSSVTEPRTCMTDDCTRIAVCRNLCGYHYDKARREGTRDQYPKMRGEFDTEHPAYSTVHMRLRNTRGPASTYTCPCGQPARDWVFDDQHRPGTLTDPATGFAYSADLTRYTARCRRCHAAQDGRRKWDPVCAVYSCDGETKAHGYCSRHEKRYRRYGSPEFQWVKKAEAERLGLPA